MSIGIQQPVFDNVEFASGSISITPADNKFKCIITVQSVQDSLEENRYTLNLTCSQKNNLLNFVNSSVSTADLLLFLRQMVNFEP